MFETFDFFIESTEDWKTNAKHKMSAKMYCFNLLIGKRIGQAVFMNWNGNKMADIWCFVFDFQSSADTMKRTCVDELYSTFECIYCFWFNAENI